MKKVLFIILFLSLFSLRCTQPQVRWLSGGPDTPDTLLQRRLAIFKSDTLIHSPASLAKRDRIIADFFANRCNIFINSTDIINSWSWRVLKSWRDPKSRLTYYPPLDDKTFCALCHKFFPEKWSESICDSLFKMGFAYDYQQTNNVLPFSLSERNQLITTFLNEHTQESSMEKIAMDFTFYDIFNFFTVTKKESNQKMFCALCDSLFPQYWTKPICDAFYNWQHGRSNCFKVPPPSLTIYPIGDVTQGALDKYTHYLRDNYWNLFARRIKEEAVIYLSKIPISSYPDCYAVEIYLALTEDCPLRDEDWIKACNKINWNLHALFADYNANSLNVPKAQLTYINKNGNQLSFVRIKLLTQTLGRWDIDAAAYIYCDPLPDHINYNTSGETWYVCRSIRNSTALEAYDNFCSHPFANCYHAKRIANVRKFPSIKSPIITQIDSAVPLRLLSLYGDWFKVRYDPAYDHIGWVHKSVVKE